MINPKNPINLLRRSFNQWSEHDVPRLGAALAFYAILSISPLVILSMAMVSSVVDRSQAQAQLLDQVQTLVGPEGRGTVQTLLVAGQTRSSGSFCSYRRIRHSAIRSLWSVRGIAFGVEYKLGRQVSKPLKGIGHSPQACLLYWNGLQCRVPAHHFSVGQHCASCSHNIPASHDAVATSPHDDDRLSHVVSGHCSALRIDLESTYQRQRSSGRKFESELCSGPRCLR